MERCQIRWGYIVMPLLFRRQSYSKCRLQQMCEMLTREIVFIRGNLDITPRITNRSIETRLNYLFQLSRREIHAWWCINIVWKCIIDSAFETSIHIHFVLQLGLRTIATLAGAYIGIPCRTFVAMNRLWARKASMRIWRWDSHSLFSITLQPWFRAIK